MTSNEIRQEIARCQSTVDGLNSEIKKLQADMEQLELLRKKFGVLQSDFAQRQSERVSRLNASSEFSNLQCGRTYREGMLNLLNGNEFARAYNALGDDVSKIRSKQLEIDNTICDKQGKIAALQCKLTELNIQYDEALRLEVTV